MNKVFDFEALDQRGVRILKHTGVELDAKSCYFYALRLKQRFGMRPVSIRWKERGTTEWITFDPK